LELVDDFVIVENELTMEEQQILDNEFKKASIPKTLLRWQWHLKHALIIISLYLIVVFSRQYILPYLPEVISDLLSLALGVIMMLGTYFITAYVCRVGYQWNWGLVFIGASFIFFSCFIYSMSTLDYWIEVYSPKLQTWTSMSNMEIKRTLEILLVGVIYSCAAVILIESLALLTGFILALYRLVKKE
jgi:hypothetical protein